MCTVLFIWQFKFKVDSWLLLFSVFCAQAFYSVRMLFGNLFAFYTMRRSLFAKDGMNE